MQLSAVLRAWLRCLCPWVGLGLVALTVWQFLWWAPNGPPARPLPVEPHRLLSGNFGIVILDPGHGGVDSGAIGRGLQEKTITLSLAEALAAELRSRGLTTVLTRTTDEYVSLVERVNFARTVPGAIFLSLHCNYADNPAAHGIELYRAQQKGDAEPTLILTATGLQPLADAEEQLAGSIRDSLTSRLRCDRRPTKSANFFVIRNLSIPALLIECGYLTNPEEARKLNSPVFRASLAAAVADGIFSYRTSMSPRRSVELESANLNSPRS
ncbi:MAG TPA: N-acetylmuramoyl-L-alanine amidase [Chthoniobacterales bacterium]